MKPRQPCRYCADTADLLGDLLLLARLESGDIVTFLKDADKSTKAGKAFRKALTSILPFSVSSIVRRSDVLRFSTSDPSALSRRAI